MKLIKDLFYKYQKFMWYVSQTGTEVGKPLRFYSESALLLLLAKSFGFKINIFLAIGIYILILVIAAIIGKILAEIGVVKYNTKLSNNHNEEISEILKILKKNKK